MNKNFNIGEFVHIDGVVFQIVYFRNQYYYRNLETGELKKIH